MPRIGVVVEGISNLKILGPIIGAAANAGVSLTVYISADSGGRAYDALTPEALVSSFLHISPGSIKVVAQNGLVAAVERDAIDAFVCINPYHKYSAEVADIAGLGIATYGLDYFANGLYIAAKKGMDAQVEQCLAHITRHFVSSSFWYGLERAVSSLARTWSDKYTVASSPLYDVMELARRSRRPRELASIAGKKAICVMTPNIRSSQLRHVYGLFGGYRIWSVLRALRRWCDDNGYKLVVKTRDKHWDARMYRDVADVYIAESEDVTYPYTSSFLLQDCRALIHFGSMAVLEAAIAGTPSIGIGVERIDRMHGYMKDEPRKIIRDELLSSQQNSIFNFGTVSQSVPFARAARQILSLLSAVIDNPGDPQKYEQYQDIFIGTKKDHVAQDILATIQGDLRAADRR